MACCVRIYMLQKFKGGSCLQTLLSIIIIISSIIIIAVVAQMESDQAGLGTLQGEETTMWGSHKGSSKKDIQNKIVMI